jgi:hypothetical protein
MKDKEFSPFYIMMPSITLPAGKVTHMVVLNKPEQF